MTIAHRVAQAEEAQASSQEAANEQRRAKIGHILKTERARIAAIHAAAINNIAQQFNEIDINKIEQPLCGAKIKDYRDTPATVHVGLISENQMRDELKLYLYNDTSEADRSYNLTVEGEALCPRRRKIYNFIQEIEQTAAYKKFEAKANREGLHIALQILAATDTGRVTSYGGWEDRRDRHVEANLVVSVSVQKIEYPTQHIIYPGQYGEPRAYEDQPFLKASDVGYSAANDGRMIVKDSEALTRPEASMRKGFWHQFFPTASRT